MQDDDWSEQEMVDEESLLRNIDSWEKESIAKIRNTADSARADLQRLMANLRSSTEVDNQLSRWVKQFKQLQTELLSSIVHLSNIVTTKERFSKVIGSAILKEDGLLAQHTNEDWNYEYILGERLYLQGRHTISFKIEQNGTPYKIFFGCISSQALQTRISIQSSFTIGWFGDNQIYRHGILHHDHHVHHYNSHEFATDDILHLIFDCEKKQIELFHEETKKTHILRVNIIKAPLPWQLLIVLTDKDDCVRIISRQKSPSTDFLIE